MPIFSISKDGYDTRSASNEQLLVNSDYPFAKLDTQNNVSFQNIRIFFSRDTPFTAGATVKTLVYSFAHGYTYVPQVWVLYQNQGSTGLGTGFSYGYEDSLILGNDAFNTATLHIEVDSQNVNVYVIKQTSAIPNNPNIASYVLLLRVYVFVDDVGV